MFHHETMHGGMQGKHMTIAAIRNLGLSALLASALAAAEEPPPELLKKLAAHDARVQQSLSSGSVTVTSLLEELDGDGKVLHTQESVARLVQRNGRQEEELVKTVRDGKDVTEEARKKRAGNGAWARSQGRAMIAGSPFGAEDQPHYRYTVLGNDPGNPAFVRIGFGPREKPSQEIATGEALVDPAAGELVRIAQRPSKLPAFVDEIETTIDLGARTPGGRLVSRMKFHGKGGFLFVKKRGRGTLNFSDYQLPPATAPAR